MNECWQCKKDVGFKSGRNFYVEVALFITTFWLLWLPLILYYAFTPRWICINCGSKVLKK